MESIEAACPGCLDGGYIENGKCRKCGWGFEMNDAKAEYKMLSLMIKDLAEEWKVNHLLLEYDISPVDPMWVVRDSRKGIPNVLTTGDFRGIMCFLDGYRAALRETIKGE